jgi:hypothetical protein
MGVAYYIAFDQDDFSTDFTDGKSVARAFEKLNALAEELGVPPLEEFMGQSMDELGDMLGEDIDLDGVADGDAKWFEPSAGIFVFDALISALQDEPQRVKSAAAVIEDLESYKAALHEAEVHGARWHLAIDF